MKSNKLPYFFFALAAILSAAAIFLIFNRSSKQETPKEAVVPPVTEEEATPEIVDLSGKEEETAVTQTSEETLKDLGIGVRMGNPSELLDRIGKALEANDLQRLGDLIGKEGIRPEQLEKIRAMNEGDPIRIREIREIGEIERNELSRWVFDLDAPEGGRKQMFFTLRSDDKNRWSIDSVLLPGEKPESQGEAVYADSLGIVDSFLQAVLSQNFESALKYIVAEEVSEAKIAALCILFEEGRYEVRKEKPLRKMFSREDTVGYIANLTTDGGEQPARFSVNLRQFPQKNQWKIIEINLDSLLTDYANRYAGGDVYYSPLVKNPAGGETLALYFEFDEDRMSPRTESQLKIVAGLLKADLSKKITLSGHTDALGSDSYNDELSARRAQTVRDYLASAGVNPSQIVTVAKGASQPRRPNVTETGEDDPSGRRANRRTEIYLDF